MDKIKPCPFCGKPPITCGAGEGQKGFMIECVTPNCVAPHVSYYGREMAIAAWNRRPSHPVTEGDS